MTIIEVSGIIFLALLFEVAITAFTYLTGDEDNLSVEIIFILLFNICVIVGLGSELYKSNKEVKELKATYEVATESEKGEDL